MGHISIDKVLYALSGESGARPSIDLAARVPGTSRVERTKAKDVRRVKPVTKGLARSAVAVVRRTPTSYEVVVKGTRAFVGRVHRLSGKEYSYQLMGRVAVAGYPSQAAAVKAMLVHV